MTPREFCLWLREEFSKKIAGELQGLLSVGIIPENGCISAVKKVDMFKIHEKLNSVDLSEPQKYQPPLAQSFVKEKCKCECHQIDEHRDKGCSKCCGIYTGPFC